MAEAMEAWLPRLLAERTVEAKVIDHGSKWALLNNLPARMKGYANWPLPGLRILVLVDRDDDDCADLKRQLEAMARSAGLATKTVPAGSGAFKVVNRIVVEELEAWFLGDVPALTDAFPGVPLTLGSQARFRDPDAVTGGTWEALLRVLNKAGHYTGAPRLPKIEVARRMAPIMRFERNRSRSFQAFLAGFEALLAV
jgi:hypothetical protein